MTDRDEGRMEAAERLRAYVRMNGQGGCRMLSEGDDCKCLLCDIDRLLRAEPAGDVGEEHDARILHQVADNMAPGLEAMAVRKIANRLARLRRTPETEMAVSKALVEWSDKYPPERIYPYSIASKITRELQEIVEKARLATQDSNAGGSDDGDS